MTTTVVIGGQFGSEGKGAWVEHISRHVGANVYVRIGGPQAGHHVTKTPGAAPGVGGTFSVRSVPAGFHDTDAILYLGRSSIVEWDRLYYEISTLEDLGHSIMSRIFIHPEATVLSQEHVHEETELGRGSTRTGVGAAISARVMRTAKTASTSHPEWAAHAIGVVDLDVDHVVVETAQGWGLGLYNGYYPYTTSRQVDVWSALSDAGVPFGVDVECHMVIRAMPIRVGGDSGPLVGETTWNDIGVEPERTSVTNRIRRVADFDSAQVRRAIDDCRPTTIAVTHIDYFKDSGSADAFLENVRGYGVDRVYYSRSHAVFVGL